LKRISSHCTPLPFIIQNHRQGFLWDDELIVAALEQDEISDF
jgi:hypothetical protein